MKPLDPRLVGRSHGVRSLLVLTAGLGLASAGTVIAQAVVIATLVDQLFSSRPLTHTAWALAGVFLVRGLLHWANSSVSERAAVTVKAELRHELANDLLDARRLGPAPDPAAVTAIMGPGFDAFDGYVSRFLPQLVLVCLVPPVVIATMFFVDPASAAIVAITLPLSVAFMVLIGLMTRDKLSRRWESLERLSLHFAQVLDGLVVLKLFGRRQERNLTAVGQRHRDETMRSLRLAFLSSLVLELVATLSVALVAVSVGLRVVDGGMDLRPALIVLLLAPEAYLPVRQLGMMFHDSTEGAAAVTVALDLLDHDRQTGGQNAPSLRTSTIRLSNVSVQHPSRSTPSLVIDELEIHPGEYVAVVGPTGCGKSTLLDVMLSFIVPTAGHITVAGTDLREIDPDQWRHQIAWVPQVPGLIAGTISDNVRLACAVASDVNVRQALDDAGAADLPLSRTVSEAGSDVSAGERRRIAVARALLRVRVGGAQLVLLDEPTAGLDDDREASVLASLAALDATVVVVAHRQATISAATRVIRVQTPTAVIA
ncbi:thiol reductant ABC exporter CydD subunit [Aeromicrobium panaciterrae]|uniref:Thiol reductant ABC exporter CydD subunit n=1 Tax=Aeromicrobium panaciterrae TaxID=363861 RepID=A0ABU1UJ80_9ACTN|nr:thiol reductant ABC exporter subunit CydD [Aeromicrobium panaciterrae]MDR7085205.1 thiol reductant ABC exporter CydD subunit [Aeromicrobium panaciterrae]